MSAVLDTQTTVVVKIAENGATPASSRGVTIYAKDDGPIAHLLGQLLADPDTVKVVSQARRDATGRNGAAHDFCTAMRLVEQECYQPA